MGGGGLGGGGDGAEQWTNIAEACKVSTLEEYWADAPLLRRTRPSVFDLSYNVCFCLPVIFYFYFPVSTRFTTLVSYGNFMAAGARGLADC